MESCWVVSTSLGSPVPLPSPQLGPAWGRRGGRTALTAGPAASLDLA